MVGNVEDHLVRHETAERELYVFEFVGVDGRMPQQRHDLSRCQPIKIVSTHCTEYVKLCSIPPDDFLQQLGGCEVDHVDVDGCCLVVVLVDGR